MKGGIGAGLFCQQRPERAQQCSGKNLGALRGGMNSIGLQRAWLANQVLIHHRHKRNMVLRGKFAVHLIEVADVVGPVIRRERNTCKQNSAVTRGQRAQQRVKILPGLTERKSAQAVVASKFDNDDCGMKSEQCLHSGNGILCRRAAGAQVPDLVVVGELVEVTLQIGRVGLIFGETISSRDAVAVTDQQMGLRRVQDEARKNQRD